MIRNLFCCYLTAVHETWVAEKLLDKVYKNVARSRHIEAKIKCAVTKLVAIDK